MRGQTYSTYERDQKAVLNILRSVFLWAMHEMERPTEKLTLTYLTKRRYVWEHF